VAGPVLRRRWFGFARWFLGLRIVVLGVVGGGGRFLLLDEGGVRCPNDRWERSAAGVDDAGVERLVERGIVVEQ
jgi:hypothetical protein